MKKRLTRGKKQTTVLFWPLHILKDTHKTKGIAGPPAPPKAVSQNPIERAIMLAKRRIKPHDDAPARLAMVTPEFLRHHEVEQTTLTHFGDGKELKPHRAVTLRVKNQRLIDRYFFGPPAVISLNQHAAADRLYDDHQIAGRPAKVTANLTGVGGGGGSNDMTNRQIAAGQRIKSAMAAIPWRDRTLVLRVILDDAPAGRRSAKKGYLAPMDRFIRALDRLIKHYGIS